MYYREHGQGRGVGAFIAGQDQGKTLVTVEKGERIEAEWLPGTKKAIAITYLNERGDDGEVTRVQVHLMDAEAQSAKLIFNRPFAKSENPRMDVDPSPKLLHAIFRLRSTVEKKTRTEHYVLKTGTPELANCPELDGAATKGFRGPVWSLDGTAIFMEGSGTPTYELRTGIDLKLDETALKLAEAQRQGDKQLQAITIELQGTLLNQREKLAFTTLGGGNRWIARPAAPPVGTPVLELMPQNGVLRQVNFKGQWAESLVPTPSLQSQERQVVVEFGRSRSQSKSIWLTLPGKEPEHGTLVSSNASQAWLSPKNRMVAYLTDRALFVREISQK